MILLSVGDSIWSYDWLELGNKEVPVPPDQAAALVLLMSGEEPGSTNTHICTQSETTIPNGGLGVYV